jgi:pyruvate formate lyase activating enzyme
LKEALLYEKIGGAGNKVACRLCNHYCVIEDGALGFCAVRLNEKGKLYSLSYGKSTGFAVDPIEKKPFYHFRPGTPVLSFGTPGCNFRCLGCQNWDLSQLPRNSKEPKKALDSIPTTLPKRVAELCLENDCAGVAYTYSEPTIFFEYARDCIAETRKIDKNKYHCFVSNGYFSPQAFDVIKKEKLLEAIRIDLKFADDAKYRDYCGAKAGYKVIVDNIKRVFESKIHCEVINLLVPGLNDDNESVRKTVKLVAGVSKDIPLHFLKFFPHYQRAEGAATSDEALLRAREIACGEGLKYVYLGNTALPGGGDTQCPKCGTVLVKRSGFGLVENKLIVSKTHAGKCPKCGERIYGAW